MSARAGWWLFTDPHFEQIFNLLGTQGFGVSVITRDEFEETVKSGSYQVDRMGLTILGTHFDSAMDEKNGVMLITADPPSTENPPPEPPQKGLTLLGKTTIFGGGLARPAFTTISGDYFAVPRVQSVIQVEMRWINRQLIEARRESLRKKARYIR
jgi:hypothetical protein